MRWTHALTGGGGGSRDLRRDAHHPQAEGKAGQPAPGAWGAPGKGVPRPAPHPRGHDRILERAQAGQARGGAGSVAPWSAGTAAARSKRNGLLGAPRPILCALLIWYGLHRTNLRRTRCLLRPAVMLLQLCITTLTQRLRVHLAPVPPSWEWLCSATCPRTIGRGRRQQGGQEAVAQAHAAAGNRVEPPGGGASWPKGFYPLRAGAAAAPARSNLRRLSPAPAAQGITIPWQACCWMPSQDTLCGYNIDWPVSQRGRYRIYN